LDKIFFTTQLNQCIRQKMEESVGGAPTWTQVFKKDLRKISLEPNTVVGLVRIDRKKRKKIISYGYIAN
jgi:hypothetical protein